MLIEVDRYVDVNLEMGKALKKSYANNGPVIIFRNNGTEYKPEIAALKQKLEEMRGSL